MKIQTSSYLNTEKNEYLLYLAFSFITFPSVHSAAAAAKSLQSRLTLCDPIDGSPPGSPVPGILLTCLLRNCRTLVKKQ